jgi:RND family efflux transporter MFP subunit
MEPRLRRRSGGAIIGVAAGLVGVLAPIGLDGWTSASGQQSPIEGRTSRDEGLQRRDDGPRKVKTFVIHRRPVEWRATQDFSVHPSELANLYANVSGYLARQTVDIGDRVAKDQLLAEAQAKQAGVRIRGAEADQKAIEASIPQAEAEAQKLAAERAFREKEYNRIAGLARQNALEPRLVDEEEKRRESAISADVSGRAAVTVARAKAEAARVGVDQAAADHDAALANVRVAKEKLAEARILVAYTQILAPYDGVIIARNYHLGDFIRSGATGGSSQPILTVARTEKMRVVIQVPGSYLPLLNSGDPAVIQVAGLGVPLQGQITRTTGVVDPATNLTRAEIDLATPGGRIRPGMTGKATIVLEPPHEAVIIPTSAIAYGDGATSCFRVENGRAVRTNVTIGSAALQQAEILDGIKEGDIVILDADGLQDGQPIAAVSGDGQPRKPR